MFTTGRHLLSNYPHTAKKSYSHYLCCPFSTIQTIKPSRFKSDLTIGIVPADGIGKQVIPAACKVLNAALPFKPSLIHLDAGFEHFEKTGIALPQETIECLKSKCDGALFGAVSSPLHHVKGYTSPIITLRKQLDLFANIRPIIEPFNPYTTNTNSRIDMLIVRENTECLYIKNERLETDHKSGLITAFAERKISSYASRRIAKIAFDAALARHHSRCKTLAEVEGSIPPCFKHPKVTVVHKANILSITDGLFRDTVFRVWNEYPEYKNLIALDEQLVDSMVYKMIRQPYSFDVIVAPNLYGDIISDAAAALVGSLGVVAGANVGSAFVMGEPVHGSAPDISGKEIANPIAAIRSAALLLEYIGHSDIAKRIYASVDKTLVSGHDLTPDLGGKGTTESVTDIVISHL
ncbi:hypothetical protein BATDEDRAFT_85530 [Batrachochytrium dendrobatidis JAM81]|uniref:Isopropylmalate dehydrogenase-like domain-containing protein n=1 Tax=Batrachochytrium dendrobatidis (strain JAM81 / FGSC 10211) TaxID=684364 RepID=F4NTN8_BATDJ|nr:homoisocitrate dehydrogenase [Batrachochytrium dendrobatidis JAM81]EGF83929.1 hypothetical protein BATDEDRAFT_85530 [Batrachochytrium dendrobatidis JAM81]KAK5671779.1 homoisocitrate dehydrogenase [Batrachochytrium dendrobatidis]|eukprot:XP_006676277.1 hypothetical protein BATDEDRAFT_85530 [Batrachochytrium dendrobatidis JAM81]